MNTQLLIDNRKGDIFEIPHGDIQFKTGRVGRAGSLEFNFVGGDVFSEKISIDNGNIVLLKINDKDVFYGYVFKINNDGEKTKVTCYDQLRYLKNKDTKVFVNKKASDVLKVIAKENEIKLGSIADTKYSIPKIVGDNKEYFDIITQALQDTTVATGRLYVLRDNIGSLELLDIENTKLDIVLDGDGLLTGYGYSRDIDSDTFNRVKLVREDEENGIREVFIDQDSNNIARWGRLQYFEKVDKKMNNAQVKEIARTILKLKNKEKKSLKLECIGDMRCMAGYSVYIIIQDEGIEGYYLINEATHKITENEHTMSLELVVI